MIVECISDLHGFYPKLKGGDLLLIAGDLTAKHTPEEHDSFCSWLDEQPHSMKIVVSGNHDENIDPYSIVSLRRSIYLQDSGFEFKGLKIWGSPWTKTFKGMNPKCKAFTYETERDLKKKWALIPDGLDILITHGPPYGRRDKNMYGICLGSKTLALMAWLKTPSKLWIFGHIHEAYGEDENGINGCRLINCSHVNENLRPINDSILIKL